MDTCLHQRQQTNDVVPELDADERDQKNQTVVSIPGVTNGKGTSPVWEGTITLEDLLGASMKNFAVTLGRCFLMGLAFGFQIYRVLTGCVGIERLDLCPTVTYTVQQSDTLYCCFLALLWTAASALDIGSSGTAVDQAFKLFDSSKVYTKDRQSILTTEPYNALRCLVRVNAGFSVASMVVALCLASTWNYPYFDLGFFLPVFGLGLLNVATNSVCYFLLELKLVEQIADPEPDRRERSCTVQIVLKVSGSLGYDL